MKKDELKEKNHSNDQAETPEASPSSLKLKKWFPDLSDDQIERLVIYLRELTRFNKSLNLVSPLTIKNAESVHVADCVYAAQYIRPQLDLSEPLYDFGSGNGCPGVLIAALYPEVKVILIDRDHRKMEFCKHVIHAMGLSNVEVQVKSVEEFQPASVKQAVARGFAPLSKALIKYRTKFPKGGKFFHMKGDGWANELASLPSQIFSHWTPSLIGKYKIPENAAEMFVVLTEKIAD